MRKLMLAGFTAALLSAASYSSAQVPAERYGHWDPSWGDAPPAPQHQWRRWQGHEGEWSSHVHNCMVRFPTYDAHRDMYRKGRRWIACVD